MGAAQTQVSTLVEETITLLTDCDPGGNDPLLDESWDLLVSLTHMAATRLLEPRFGGLLGAADEVLLYLGQLERVSRVVPGAPFRVPTIALRPLKAAGRFVENSNDIDEVCTLLMCVPQLAAGYSAYLIRTGGRSARPVLDLLDLAVRAGGVYRESFTRTVPSTF